MIICEANFSSFVVKLNIISRLTAFALKIVCNDAMRRAISSFLNGDSAANKNRVRGIA